MKRASNILLRHRMKNEVEINFKCAAKLNIYTTLGNEFKKFKSFYSDGKCRVK